MSAVEDLRQVRSYGALRSTRRAGTHAALNGALLAAVQPWCDVVAQVPEGLACVFRVLVGFAERRDVAGNLHQVPLESIHVDRYNAKTDKASGIVNDPNQWGQERGDHRYIVDLAKRVVTVSLQTAEIVDSLPALDFG